MTFAGLLGMLVSKSSDENFVREVNDALEQLRQARHCLASERASFRRCRESRWLTQSPSGHGETSLILHSPILLDFGLGLMAVGSRYFLRR